MNKIIQKNYLGIDVSKPWFDVSLLVVIDHLKQPMLSERFDNSIIGMKQFKGWLKLNKVSLDENSLLVIENTGVYHRLIWSFCSKHSLPINSCDVDPPFLHVDPPEKRAIIVRA